MLTWLFGSDDRADELYQELVSARFMHEVMMRNFGVESEKASKYERRIEQLERELAALKLAA